MFTDKCACAKRFFSVKVRYYKEFSLTYCEICLARIKVIQRVSLTLTLVEKGRADQADACINISDLSLQRALLVFAHTYYYRGTVNYTNSHCLVYNVNDNYELVCLLLCDKWWYSYWSFTIMLLLSILYSLAEAMATIDKNINTNMLVVKATGLKENK